MQKDTIIRTQRNSEFVRAHSRGLQIISARSYSKEYRAKLNYGIVHKWCPLYGGPDEYEITYTLHCAWFNRRFYLVR